MGKSREHAGGIGREITRADAGLAPSEIAHITPKVRCGLPADDPAARIRRERVMVLYTPTRRKITARNGW